MKHLAIDMPVSWLNGTGRRAIVLSGHVVELNGKNAYVRSNGEVYEVAKTKLRRRDFKQRRACKVCGELVADLRSRFCSARCAGDYVCSQTNDAVFEALVQLKIERQGITPTLPEIADRAGLDRHSVGRAVRSLVAAGRIWYEGTERHKQIGIPGGKWTYEGGDFMG